MSETFAPNRLTRYDDDSVIAEIKRVVNQHFRGITPSRDEFDKYSRVKSQTIRKRFGTWANGIRSADFAYAGSDYETANLKRDRYSADMMLSDLQRAMKLNGGKYFTQEWYALNGGAYSIKTLKNHFRCSWATLLSEQLSIAPTFTPRFKLHRPRPLFTSEYSDEALVSEMKRVWDSLGRRPKYAEFKKFGKIGVHIYEAKYGGWKQAVAYFCGSSPIPLDGIGGGHATPALLRAELKRIGSQSGSNMLTFGRYSKLGGQYSIGAFQNHLGGWRKAVEEIGLRHGRFGKYSDEELFTELQRLWELYGRQPTYKEMNRDGSISGGVYQRRFGSWIKAIHAFCSDRESPDIEKSIATEILAEGAIPAGSANQEPPIANPGLTAIDSATTILVDSRRCATPKQRFLVKHRDNFTCVYCKRHQAIHHVDLVVDHIIPWSQGGLTVLENLQTTCKECNRDKSDLLLQS